MAQIDSISKPEAIKQQSRQLRGHIARDLPDTKVPFDKEGYALLKFHGFIRVMIAIPPPNSSSVARANSGSSWSGCGSPADG